MSNLLTSVSENNTLSVVNGSGLGRPFKQEETPDGDLITVNMDKVRKLAATGLSEVPSGNLAFFWAYAVRRSS